MEGENPTLIWYDIQHPRNKPQKGVFLKLKTQRSPCRVFVFLFFRNSSMGKGNFEFFMGYKKNVRKVWGETRIINCVIWMAISSGSVLMDLICFFHSCVVFCCIGSKIMSPRHKFPMQWCQMILLPIFKMLNLSLVLLCPSIWTNI